MILDKAAQDLLFRSARTANTFTDEPVTDEEIQAIHDLVRFGPTAYNAQPLRIVLVPLGERQRLLPHLSKRNRSKTATAPLVAILAADTGFHEHLPVLWPHRPALRDSFDNDPAGREAHHHDVVLTVQGGHS
jgi:3-hydroxypropanoate dehydrogenase